MGTEYVRRVALAAVMTIAAAGSVRAQEPAGNLNQLRVLVKRGDRISITPNRGPILKGTIAELSADAIRLRTGIHEQDIVESEIRTIRQRRDDSLADGARKGFGTGAWFGLFAAGIAYHSMGAAAFPVMIGFYGSMGAAIGTGIDAMVTHNRTIYDSAWRQPKAASVRFGVRLR